MTAQDKTSVHLRRIWAMPQRCRTFSVAWPWTFSVYRCSRCTTEMAWPFELPSLQKTVSCLLGQCLPHSVMPAVFTNAGLFTFRKLTDTQTLPTRSWFIALSPLIQPWLTRVTYTVVYSPEEAQIVCSEMKGWFPTGCISMRDPPTTTT